MTDLTIIEDKNSYLSQGNFDHYYRIANMMANSTMVPKAYQGKDKAPDVLIAMEYGRTVKLGPLQALQNIAVINGKPSMYGDAVLAVCSGHPEFENIIEEKLLDGTNKLWGYKCTVQRRSRDATVKTFTVESAKLANLWGKSGPWTNYPERMLQMRARGFALRDSFADALCGVQMREEVEDYEMKDITPRLPSNVLDDLKALIDKNKIDKNKIDKNKNVIIDSINQENIHQDTRSTHGTSQTVNMESANKIISAETGEIIESVDSHINQEANAENKSRDSVQINDDQLLKINDLMKEKKFNLERKNKALEYFRVNTFESLSEEQAEIFIGQLEKI